MAKSRRWRRKKAGAFLKVLRMNVGDELCAIDGCGGRFEAKIDSVDQNIVWLTLCNRLPDNEFYPPFGLRSIRDSRRRTSWIISFRS